MKKQDEMSEITYMNYSNSTPWPDKDIWHDYTYKAIVSIVEQWLQKYTNSEMVLLNAGSGGTEYKTNARVIHLDIVEKYISQFDNYLVGSVEKIELPDASLDGIWQNQTHCRASGYGRFYCTPENCRSSTANLLPEPYWGFCHYKLSADAADTRRSVLSILIFPHP